MKRPESVEPPFLLLFHNGNLESRVDLSFSLYQGQCHHQTGLYQAFLHGGGVPLVYDKKYNRRFAAALFYQQRRRLRTLLIRSLWCRQLIC